MIPRDRNRRRTAVFRLVTIFSLVVMAAAFVLPQLVSAADDNPYTTISPQTGVARDIQWLYKFIFWGALIVFIGVQFGIAYTVLRYRRRSDSDARPEQVHGNKTLEITWTIIPAVILLAIFIPTVRTMFSTEAKADDGEKSGYTIEVYGKQWWWEAHYTAPTDVADVITANEIYVPVDRPISIKLLTNNVIHSFWVPQLTGKMDLIPGHVNKIGFTVEQPGVYFGECAEFCGDAHAFMRFKLIAVDQASFDKWIAGWKAGPSSAAAQVSGDVAKVPPAFGICLACHRVNGTNANVAPVGLEEDAGTEAQPGSARTAGPNLSDFACRTTIGAGILPNDEEHLREWLHDPGAIKQGNHMASVIKKGTLSDDQIDQIVAYLKTLHPEDGCVPLTGTNADGVVQLASAASSAAVESINPFH